MTTQQPLKVAVLSFAHLHSGSYLRKLAQDPSIEVIATDPEGISGQEGPRGAEYAQIFGVNYVDSYAEAFAWKPDAVVICSENAKHVELIEQAAAAGAHVLCEKPLATSIEAGRQAIARVEEAGLKFMTAFPVRFSPDFQRLKAMVKAGMLGEIISVVGTNNGWLPAGRAWFTDPALAGGGALVDHVVHCADLLDDLLEAQAQTVYAVANKILHSEQQPQVETGGLVTVTYDSGVIATIDCSWSQAKTAPNWGGLTLSVTGTKGSVKIDPFASHVGGYDAEGAAWLSFGTDMDSLMIDEFIAAIREDRAPQPGAGSGLRTLEIVKAAQASVASGKAFAVAELANA